ncbi:MAG: hypothetical protein WCO26_22575 [Deltaproteobacteria bacterium]
MEKERVQRYVASLEQVMRSAHLDLRETMIQFQEYSRRLTTERTVPPGIITDIRRIYMGIHDQLTKIRGIHQLLENRYKPYYRRDHLRDREVSEFGILSKKLYSRFESMLQEIEANGRLKDKEENSEVCTKRISFQWFRSRENQLILLGNLRGLYELDYIYKTGPGVDVDRKQRVIQDKLRSLSLFVLSGEGGLIDILQSRIRLREYDIKERFAKDELRGALTHLREISAAEVEGVIKRYMDSREVPKLKCLLLSIQSQEDLVKQALGSADTILREMTGGEVRTLRI